MCIGSNNLIKPQGITLKINIPNLCNDKGNLNINEFVSPTIIIISKETINSNTSIYNNNNTDNNNNIE